MMKRYLMMLCLVMVLIVNIAGAAINLTGAAEMLYDSDSNKFTAEDSKIAYSAEIRKGLNAEIVWKNNALNSYSLSYEKFSGFVITGGLITTPFGQYYSHLISDPQFSEDKNLNSPCDIKRPGFKVSYTYDIVTVAGGIFNNSATTGSKAGEVDLYALDVAFDVYKGVVVGAGYFKDGDEEPASNVYCEAIVDLVTIDGEYGVRDEDTFASIGVAYQIMDELEIAARGESVHLDAADDDYTVIAVGGNYLLEKGLTISTEYKVTDEDQNALAKVSLEF